ncbi:MAG: sulfatase-like hydrolase/transferase [Candidatus Sumerlaeota bacterium]|nr:sulfatase-like hydrolase/transferase [Candidatus Sumerlaeota bacterium]
MKHHLLIFSVCAYFLLMFRAQILGAEAAAAAAAVAAVAAGKPNVILIVTDDQGAMDAGCYGAKDLATPAIDALAARGVRFTQFYSGAPVCSPSRAALLTGRYPLRAGLIGNAGSQPGGAGMPGAQITLAEMMKAGGYATAHIGKWHLGYTSETMPNAQGFDYSFGHIGGCIDNYSHFFYWQGPNRHDLYRNGQEVFYPGRFFGDMMVEEASRFLDQNRERPFFLYFALNMPHYPYQGDPKWLERYKDLPYPRNLYAAFVSTLDERIGALMKKADDLGLRERTIVIYQSDNGHSTEERAHKGGGSAGPYRGAKFSLFEGGIRLPAIISWPGRLPEGVVRGQIVHACDWMPTITELTGAKLLNSDIDGKSIVPVVRSETAPTPHDVLHWHVVGGQWAVRQGEWKLIGNAQDTSGGKLSVEDKKLFLSNLATDISESRNFAKDHPDITQRLLKLHEEWLKAQKESVPETPSQDKAGNEK